MNAIAIIPCLGYKNPQKAIKWLGEAFGFEQHRVYEENGTIIHAELKCGNTMIMIGAQEGSGPYKKLITHPQDIKGYSTQSPYVIIDNVKKHYKKAKKNGVEIAIEFKSPDYGGESYSCYDLEGHLWNFGSYDPYEKEQAKMIEEVEETEAKWNRYIEANNVERMEKFMRDDWAIVGGQGITTKEQFLYSVRSGDLVHTKMDFKTKVVKVNGNTATITQLGVSEGKYKGEPFSFREWSTSVLIKSNGVWKAMLTTLIPAESKFL